MKRKLTALSRQYVTALRKHLDPLGMREHLEMVGGTFGLESAPGKGTIVLVQIPLANERARGGGRKLNDRIR